MSSYHPRLLHRLRPRGGRPEQPPHESGDYTIPDPLDARVCPIDVLAGTDFEDDNSTTITRGPRGR